MRTFYSNISSVALSYSLRSDVTFHLFFDNMKAKVWPNSTVELSEIMTPLSSEKMRKGELDEEERLIDLSNIVRRYNELDSVEEVLEIGSDKCVVQYGDILIPKIQPRMGNIYVNSSHERFICSSELIEYKCDEKKIIPRFLFYVLTHPTFAKCLYYSESGKTHRRVNSSELLKYRIPNISIEEQKLVLSQISALENKIQELKQNALKESDIINKVFVSEFCWDMHRFYSLSKEKSYTTVFQDIGNNYDLRFSPKFHRPAGQFVSTEIEQTNCLKVKNFIAEPIVLGASVSPSDFDTNGDCYYISMATVKNYRVELDESQLLSNEYVSQENKSKKKVQVGDIIMTRSGAAIGKFALVEEDINAIHSDFTMRIRLQNINKYFAYYYFRSVYFQYLIEINYKGLQNNNIFPNQIQEFPIPDISLDRQQDIVDKIKFQIDEQNKVNEEIKSLRDKIDDIIEKALTHNASEQQ